MSNASWSPAIFDAILPAAILVFAQLVRLVLNRLPKPLYAVLVAPFRNFITVRDLTGPFGKPHATNARKIAALVAVSALQSAIWLACFVASAVQDSPALLSLVRGGVGCLAWLFVSGRVVVTQPVIVPYDLFIFASIITLNGCVQLLYNAMLDPFGIMLLIPNAVLHAVCPLAFLSFAWQLPMKAVPPSPNVAQNDSVPSADQTCPEDDVTLWNWLTFRFVAPIFTLSSKRTLNESDVWKLSPFFQHKNIFERGLKYRAENPGHSLLWFLLVSNSLDLILDILLEMWGVFVGFVPPYALSRILSALANPGPESRGTAYYWILVIFLAHLSFAQVDLFQRWHTRRCYERTRGQLFCALHYKSLVRRDVSGKVHEEESSDTPSTADLGRIVNLMQGDTYAVSQRFWEFSGIFASPIRLIISLVFLYQILGWSSLFGVVVVLVAYALNYPLAKYNIKITKASWKAKDRRMNIVNELLQNVRFLKFYGWESHWRNTTINHREAELDWRVKENTVNTMITFIWTWIPSATALASFLCYTLVAGEDLTVSKAFTALALFSQLQAPMMELPGQIFAMLNANVSMHRIEAFLREKEVVDWASTIKSASHRQSQEVEVTGFKDSARFRWYGSLQLTPGTFELGPLDISFPRGELTLISGPTGSGKTALLMSLLGETECVSGVAMLDKYGHQVAFCAQTPWLEHATIRDNIIYSSDIGYNEDRYDAVVKACALAPDFEIFDAGDLTEIGEKGITLSGGQRARIALARAMYSQAKCILLDDPLAAVDMHTAQHIVSRCLSGELAKGRTIILVTHHISLCQSIASYLVEISHGQVVRQGSIHKFQDLGELQQVIDAEEAELHEEGPEATSPSNEADNLPQATENELVVNKSPKIGRLIEVEARAEGRVTAHTYMTYVRAAGPWTWVLTLLFMLLIRLIEIANQIFISKWGEAYERQPVLLNTLSTMTDRSQFISAAVDLPPPGQDVKPWLMVYLYLSLAGAFSVLFYIALGYYASLQASRHLFNSMLQNLTRAPARFFDVTPIGRILNRFTTDINTVDGALQNSSRNALSGLFNFIASLMVIMIYVPAFTPFALLIACLYIRLAPPYIRTSRDLRRLESVSLSPAFAGFDELLRGLSHVRAFGMEDRYQNQFYAKVDKFQSFDHTYWLVSGWLRWRYDCLGSLVVFATTVFALWRGLSDGEAAIVIVQAGIFAEASRQLVRVLAQLELDFNSVERIVEYLDVPQEAPAVIEQRRPPAYWPSSNEGLVIEDLVVRYAPDLPPALKGITLHVKPAEKIGVVGRTGSGKSTLAMSLLRIVEPSGGKITLDGIDISTIGLEDLRTRVTIVSQDVSLFSGSIRSNLDPMGDHTDQECWDVLERCHLKELLSRRSSSGTLTLDLPISQTGSLSAGERQLLALARAVLRRPNAIIMDEATSQIDSRLDDQIQTTIRQELSHALVITIAHRLKTIMDYDRILVLGFGEVLEFGPPKELIAKQGGAFREMCRKSADWTLLSGMV